MGKTHEAIAGRLREFIERQPVFFTAAAPLAADGSVNLSPKGLRGSPAVVDERTLHGDRFRREDDASLSAYFASKDHVGTSLDGLPGLPLPLPPLRPAGE